MQTLSFKNLKVLAPRLKGRLKRMTYSLPFSRAVKPPRGYLASTESWTGSSQYISLQGEHTIRRTIPRTLENTIDWEFTNRLEYKSPATFVAAIPNGRIAGHAVITPDDHLLADVSIEATVLPENAAKHSIFKRDFLPPVRRVTGRVAVLSAAHCENNYFHWMFDLLPRLDLLREGGFDTSNIDAFIVNSTSLPFQKETLALLGIPKTLDGAVNPHIQADILIVPSLPGIMGDIPQWTCDFLRGEFLKPEVLVETRPCRLIYVSRRNAKYRKLLNENVVTDFLKEQGVEVLELETLRFQEQVSLFNSAQIVIAPHGAGLTNLVFCKPGTKVIELFSPRYVNGCYWALSNHVNLDYYYLLGEGERPLEDASHSGGGDNYEINMTKLASLLHVVMSEI